MGKTYSEKLRDPQWQRMRLKVLERDRWACVRCKDATTTLHVHHRYYVSGRDPWDYPSGALVSLCETCHEGDPQFDSLVPDAMTDALEVHVHGREGAPLGRLLTARLLAFSLAAYIDLGEDKLLPSERYLAECEQMLAALRTIERSEG